MDEPTRAALLAEVRPIRTMFQALRWASSRTPPALFLDAVTEDEFTADVVVRVDLTSFVVFGTTWLGDVTAVAVWDHRPTASELLDHRLARGWSPTPTATREGPVVLGYAACRVDRFAS
jgi:hypothetical protein